MQLIVTISERCYGNGSSLNFDVSHVLMCMHTRAGQVEVYVC